MREGRRKNAMVTRLCYHYILLLLKERLFDAVCLACLVPRVQNTSPLEVGTRIEPWYYRVAGICRMEALGIQTTSAVMCH